MKNKFLTGTFQTSSFVWYFKFTNSLQLIFAIFIINFPFSKLLNLHFKLNCLDKKKIH